MSRSEALVVRTGLANLASVRAGLRRCGATPVETDDADRIRDAGAVVLPGVGSFAPAMTRLVERDLVAPLRDRIRDGRPTLAICLGMQLLFEGSAENGGVDGIAAVEGRAERFGPGVRVPQLGWNRIAADPSCEILRSGAVYFANSYRVVTPPAGFRIARAEHDGSFIAAIERGAILACQFHPELSGPFGLGLLEAWLACAGVSTC